MILVVWLIAYLIAAFIGAYFADYVISFWLVYLDKPDTFTWMHGFYICLIPFGVAALATKLTILTFILSFFL